MEGMYPELLRTMQAIARPRAASATMMPMILRTGADFFPIYQSEVLRYKNGSHSDEWLAYRLESFQYAHASKRSVRGVPYRGQEMGIKMWRHDVGRRDVGREIEWLTF